jgi:DDE superfamily endonuclease
MNILTLSGVRTYGSSTGRMDSELFLRWLEFFIAAVRPSLDRQVLLVLDGDTFHAKNIAATNLAKESGVILLQLPADCLHRFRPLYASFFQPLLKVYDGLMCNWLSDNPGEIVTTRPFAKVFSEAYTKTTNYENAANGFTSTGIWPIDMDVFLNTEFANTTLGCAGTRKTNF